MENNVDCNQNDKEVEISIVEGGSKLSFKVPTEMDIITAKGVIQQVTQFVRILDKTQTFGLPIQEPQKQTLRLNDLTAEEKQEFIKFYDENGTIATMNKYGLKKSQIYYQVHSYKKLLGIETETKRTRQERLDDDLIPKDNNNHNNNLESQERLDDSLVTNDDDNRIIKTVEERD